MSSSDPSNESAHDPFAAIMGETTAVKAAVALARKAALGDATVLIEGASGTGKTLFAKAIHTAGARRDGPFIACNLEGVPPAEIEARLFGDPSAGADEGTDVRPGFFQRATGGTLYLRGIDRLPPETQVRLQRLLDADPAGTPLAARLIVGSPASLRERVTSGDLRDALYYRIATLQIALPVLRERVDDIPLLAHAYLQHYQRETAFKVRIRGIHPEAIALLKRYPWPGNVRELQHVIQRAATVEETAVLTPASLPTHVVEGRAAAGDEGGAAFTPDPSSSGSWTMPEDILPFAVLERLAIESAVRVTGGNIQEAAKRLGIGRATLYRKLSKYQQDAES